MEWTRTSRGKPIDHARAPSALSLEKAHSPLPSPPGPSPPGPSPPVKRPRPQGELIAAAPAPDVEPEASPLELESIALLEGAPSTASDVDSQSASAARREREAGAELGGPRAASVALDEGQVGLLAGQADADADNNTVAVVDADAAPAAAPAATAPPPSSESLPITPSSPAKRARLAPASEAAMLSMSAAAVHQPAFVSPGARLLGLWERCVWSDEFATDGPPDPRKWAFQTDANNWVHLPSHKELQWYTEGRLENARVADGRLRICARREPCCGCAFTSARLRTKGLADWKYGRVEVCAKLPAARRGLWPAIWLVSSDNRYGSWPASGEIDVMENLGAEPGVLHGSVHTALYNHRRKSHKSKRTFRADAHEAFHVYALEWTKDGLALAVDDEVFFEFRRQPAGGSAAWPFDHPFHLILNIAVGGNWGGKDGIAEDVCPAEMEVAYVRVFQ